MCTVCTMNSPLIHCSCRVQIQFVSQHKEFSRPFKWRLIKSVFAWIEKDSCGFTVKITVITENTILQWKKTDIVLLNQKLQTNTNIDTHLNNAKAHKSYCLLCTLWRQHALCFKTSCQWRPFKVSQSRIHWWKKSWINTLKA